MAHLSSDAGLLHAFANELDVHSATAAEVFDVSLDEVTTDQRRKAKAVSSACVSALVLEDGGNEDQAIASG